MTKLTILHGEGKGKVFELNEGVSFIGRRDPSESWNPEVDLELYDVDAKISRKHARVIVHGESVEVEDLGSMNGTFVREENSPTPKRLNRGETVDIRPGQEVVFGAIVVVFARVG